MARKWTQSERRAEQRNINGMSWLPILVAVGIILVAGAGFFASRPNLNPSVDSHTATSTSGGADTNSGPSTVTP